MGILGGLYIHLIYLFEDNPKYPTNYALTFMGIINIISHYKDAYYQLTSDSWFMSPLPSKNPVLSIIRFSPCLRPWSNISLWTLTAHGENEVANAFLVLPWTFSRSKICERKLPRIFGLWGIFFCKNPDPTKTTKIVAYRSFDATIQRSLLQP